MKTDSDNEEELSDSSWVADSDDLNWLNELADYLPKKAGKDPPNSSSSAAAEEEKKAAAGCGKKEEDGQEEEEDGVFLDDSFKINPQGAQLLRTALGHDSVHGTAESGSKKGRSKKKKRKKKGNHHSSLLSPAIGSGAAAASESGFNLYNFEQSGLLMFHDDDLPKNVSSSSYNKSIIDESFQVGVNKREHEGGYIGEKEDADVAAVLDKGIVADLLSFANDETLIQSVLRNEEKIAKRRSKDGQKASEERRLRREAYGCDTCGRKLRDPGTLIAHLDRKHGGVGDGSSSRRYRVVSRRRIPTPFNSFSGPKTIDCDYCLFSTIWRNDFERHVRRHSYTERSFQCTKSPLECTKSFFDQNSLHRHETFVHNDEGRRFSCDLCSKPFKSAPHLLRHQQLVCGGARFKFDDYKKPHHDPDFDLKPPGGVLYGVCDYCLQWFPKPDLAHHDCLKGLVISSGRWKAMLRQQRNGAKTRRRYQCPRCEEQPKSFRKKEVRDLHVQRYHVNTVKCERCLATVPQHLADVHYRKHASGHICPECGAVFIRPAGLHRHRERKHPKPEKSAESTIKTETPNYTCEDCPPSHQKTFAKFKGYVAHRRIVHGIEHFDSATVQCRHCSKTYHEQRDRDRHEKKIHSDSASPCPSCTERFPTPSALRHHMISAHTGPYQCTKCPRRYQLPESLYRHRRSSHSFLKYNFF